MAEYVERNLERLLPVFELLKSTELLSDEEMKEFVKRCRQYEYRLCKREKKPTDFFKYCEYLTDFLRLIQIRREAMQDLSLRDEIDGPVKWKVAELYRLCTERFKKLDFFKKELEFLKWARLFGAASRCYTKILQTHGSDPFLHENAARWEFFENHSAENARSILQLALRKFRANIDLWVAFFDIELHYVRILAERRGFLAKKEVKEEFESDKEGNKKKPAKKINPVNLDDIPDAVFQFKLVEIVYIQALEDVPENDHPKLLYRFWKCAYDCLPISEKMEKLVYEKLWNAENSSEEAYLARILKERSEDSSMYTLYDRALEDKPSERMIRLYMEFCEDRVEIGDPYAKMKLLDLLKLLHEQNKAIENDYKRLLEVWDFSECLEKLEPYLQAALKISSKSSLLWDQFLGLKMKMLEQENPVEANVKILIKSFEDAVSKVSPEESLPIWMKFIDLIIVTSKSSKKIDKVFEHAILVTPPEVSSRIKTIRLKYLREVYPEDIGIFHDEYTNLAKILPNSENFHLDFVEMELNLPKPNFKMVHKAFNNAIAEFGVDSISCWLEYAKFLIRNQPELVGSLNSRALSNIPASLTDEFHERWMKLVQETS